MPLKTIYIARHGYRSNWLPPPHPPNPTGIDSDPALAPHGVDQARQLAEYLTLMAKEEQPQYIFSSPFYRCVETSQPISQKLGGIPIAIERGVGEWYKKSRGVVPEPANYDVLSRFFPELVDEAVWPRDESVGVIPNLSGETPEEIFDRALEFWTKFIPVLELKFPEIENIIIVTHAATKIALGMSLMKFSSVYDTFSDGKTVLRAGACSLDKYRRQGVDQWKIEMNGSCHFLADGEEMNWDFHSKFEAGSDEDIKSRREEAARKARGGLSQSQGLALGSETGPNPNSGTDPDLPSNEDYKSFYVTIDIPNTGNSSLSQFDAASSHNNQNQPISSTKDSVQATALKHNFIPSSSQLQVTSLQDPHPWVKLSNNKVNIDNDSLSLVDGNIYETQWSKLVGTDMVFDDFGELIGCVREHLTCNDNVKINPKKPTTEAPDLDEDNTSGASGVSSGKEGKEEVTAFFKKALKAANKKANQ